MAQINDLIAKLKESLNATLTKDSSPEDIKRIDGFKSELDGIEQEANKTLQEKSEVTELYIKAVKNQGSTDAPKEEVGDNPRTLEEIAIDVVNKDSKK